MKPNTATARPMDRDHTPTTAKVGGTDVKSVNQIVSRVQETCCISLYQCNFFLKKVTCNEYLSQFFDMLH